MKITFIILLASILFTFAADYRQASGSGTTLATATFSPLNSGNNLPLVYFDVTSDKAGSLLTLLTSTTARAITVTGTNSPLTFTVGSTNSLTGATGVILYRLSDNSILPCIITNLTAAGVAKVNITNASPMVAGDQVFIAITNSIAIGAATIRQAGECLFIVPGGSPLALQLDGTSACSINNVVLRQ